MYLDDLKTEFGSEGRKRKHDEDDLQAKLIEYLRWTLPVDAVAWHPPNGLKFSSTAQRRYIRLGLRAGIPDVHIAWKGRLYCIELKSSTGRLSESQRQMIAKLTACGVPVEVHDDFDEAVACIRAWGIPLNDRNLS